MQTIFKNKILILIIIIIVILTGYFLLKGSSSSSSSSGGVTKLAVSQNSSAGPTSATGPGQEFVAQLLAIQNINLNLDIFVDPVFIGLQDFSRDIPPQPVSRPNPFAPIDLKGINISSPGSQSNSFISPQSNQETASSSSRGFVRTKKPGTVPPGVPPATPAI